MKDEDLNQQASEETTLEEEVAGQTDVPEVSAEPEDKTKEMENKYMRALADYRNLERQTQTWKEEFSQYAAVPLITKLLEVLDDLENAQAHVKDDGIALIISKLKKIITEAGVVELDIINKPYDPNSAEAIGTEPGDKEDIVLKVLQKGYKLYDRVIRPAKVIVSTKAQ